MVEAAADIVDAAGRGGRQATGRIGSVQHVVGIGEPLQGGPVQGTALRGKRLAVQRQYFPRMTQPAGGGLHTLGGADQCRAKGEGQPFRLVIEPLRHLFHQRHRLRQAAACALQAHAAVFQPTPGGAGKALVEVAEALDQLTQYRNRDLRGGSWRRRAPVGGMVDQRGVGLVADSRNQRDAGLRRGPYDDLLVEGPQVLQAAATAGDDQHVRPGQVRIERRQGVKAADGRRDLTCRTLALHRDRPD